MLGAIGRSGTQGSNLAIPPYQSGPFNQLGRARWAEDGGVEPRAPGRTLLDFKACCRAGGASSTDFSEESGGLEPQRLYARPLSGRRLHPRQVHSP
jgi:hypothetical protein